MLSVKRTFIDHIVSYYEINVLKGYLERSQKIAFEQQNIWDHMKQWKTNLMLYLELLTVWQPLLCAVKTNCSASIKSRVLSN